MVMTRIEASLTTFETIEVLDGALYFSTRPVSLIRRIGEARGGGGSSVTEGNRG